MTAVSARSNRDHLLKEVLRLRISMLLINDLIKKKTFRVPIHLALGHEAIAVAISAIMEADDRLLLTHRNIHYNLARNPDLRQEVDEYLLRESGLAGGHDGAMNLTNPEAGIIYTSSILANCLPVATGVAMGQKVRERHAVTIAVTGDGALEEGAFFETLMMANSLSLPLIVLIENNEWSMHTRIEERRCDIDLKSLSDGFGMDHYMLSGNDAADYVDTLADIRRKVIAAQKPCLVEAALSTLGAFTVADDATGGERLINYHHGPAPRLSLEAGPLVEASDRDPVHVNAAHLSEADLSALAATVQAHEERALA